MMLQSRLILLLILFSVVFSCASDSSRESERDHAMARAQKFHDNEQFSVALNILDTIIRKDSIDFEAIYFRARCNFFLKNYDAAIEDLKIVSNAGYRVFDANYNIGNIYWILAQYSNAVKYFKIALVYDPSNQEVIEIIEVLEEAVEIFENSNYIIKNEVNCQCDLYTML